MEKKLIFPFLLPKFRWMLFVVAIIMAVVFSGCGGTKLSSKNKELPRKAVVFLEKIGMKDSIVSCEFGEKEHPPYLSWGLNTPKIHWTVVTTDSTLICFHPDGEWAYSITQTQEIKPKHFWWIKNSLKIWRKIRDMNEFYLCIVGVSRKGEKWIIALYGKDTNLLGPPQFYFFNDDGDFLESLIIV